MRIIIASMALLFASASFTVSAQDNKVTQQTVTEEAQMHTDRLAQALDLNEDQKAKVYRQYYAAAENTKKMLKADATNAEREAMSKKYMADKEQDFKKILTDDQYQKYLKIKDQKYDAVEKTSKQRVNKVDQQREEKQE